MTVLLTGVAGFIGYHVAAALLARGENVVGVDNLNAYYDPALKAARLSQLRLQPNFRFHCLDIADDAALRQIVSAHPDIDRIVHLAAQAGVRYSMEAPRSYIDANVMGHLTILEIARSLPGLRHLVYASSSSVYGGSTALPYTEGDRADVPLSLYAATKRAGELMSHAYTHLFAIPQTGLRFFTVYGPWGRPDMAYFAFADAIMAGRPITVYDGGRPRRDFTYIDDIVDGVIGCLDRPPASGEPPRLFNIGNHRSESVATLIALLEQGLQRRAILHHVARPRADVAETFADIETLSALTGFAPRTALEIGIPRFVSWFQSWRAGDHGGYASNVLNGSIAACA